jgi:hypothetical protein
MIGSAKDLETESSAGFSVCTVIVERNDNASPIILKLNGKVVNQVELTKIVQNRVSQFKAATGMMAATRNEYMLSDTSKTMHASSAIAADKAQSNQCSIVFLLKTEVTEHELVSLNQIAAQAGIQKIIKNNFEPARLDIRKIK